MVPEPAQVEEARGPLPHGPMTVASTNWAPGVLGASGAHRGSGGRAWLTVHRTFAPTFPHGPTGAVSRDGDSGKAREEVTTA
jgi:hypothetical protein